MEEELRKKEDRLNDWQTKLEKEKEEIMALSPEHPDRVWRLEMLMSDKAALAAAWQSLLKDKEHLQQGAASSSGQVGAGAGVGAAAVRDADEMTTRFWQALKTAQVIVVETYKFLCLSGAYFAGDEKYGSEILLRACYVSLIERIHKLRQRTESNLPGLSRFLITGTPGIGKSFFAFALLHWLAKHDITSTIVMETPTRRLLFANNGTVLVGSSTDFESALDDPETWWIVDMVEAHARKAVTIMLASPERSRYKEFLKLLGSTKLYMPLWTDEEIEVCRSRLFALQVEQKLAEDLASKWGNIPRYVLEKAHDATAQALLKAAILGCVFEEIQKCIGQPDAAQHASHRLLHLDVVEGSDFQVVCIIVASRFVADQVSEVGALRHVENLRSLVLLAIDEPATRAAAGAFFESYSHRKLQAGGKFQVRHLASNAKAELHLEASEPRIFNKVEDVRSAADAAYFMPKAHNFAAIDALQQPGTLWQMTVMQKKSVNADGLARARRQLQGKNVRLYFVVPSSLFQQYTVVSGVDTTIEQWVLNVPGFDK